MTFIKNELKVLKSFVEEFNTSESCITDFICLRKNKTFVLKSKIKNCKQLNNVSSNDFVEFFYKNKQLNALLENGNNIIIDEPKDQLKILLKLLKTIDTNNLFNKLREELSISDCIDLSKGVRSVFSKKEEPISVIKPSIEEQIIENKKVDVVAVDFNVEYDKNMADVYVMLQEVLGNISFNKCKSIAKVVRTSIKFCTQILLQKGICDSELENKIIDIYKTKGLLSYKARPKWNGFTVFSEEVRKNNKDSKTLPSQVGIMWKNLSQTEKERYKTIADDRNGR